MKYEKGYTKDEEGYLNEPVVGIELTKDPKMLQKPSAIIS